MVEDPLKMKKKDQISFVQQEAMRLQAEFDEEARIAREKEEVNVALIAQWNDTQDKKRRKFFAAKRAEKKRNRPPTKAQQRSIICTYMKNMAGWKPKDLKNKSFANVQELFDKAMKRVNTFVDMDTELVEGSKKAEEEVIEKSSSKRAVIPDEEEVEVDAISLTTKPPIIVDWKIIKEGKIGYFQIIRADGSSKRYSSMIQMLKNFDMEDLETLWKLMKAKYGSTRQEEGYEKVLWGDLKTMFEPDVESPVWRTLQDEKGRTVGIKRLHDDLGVDIAK
ncbi:hypothetical protein Tco_0882682, partial [Tanacetum coccineum]